MLQDLGQTYLLILEREEATGDTLGTKTLAAAILGSSYYYVDTGPGKHHFGILPLAY